MKRAATTLCAVLAALAAVDGANADDVAPAPCVASGLVAVLEPSAAPVTLGPAVSAATAEGLSAPSFEDAQYAVRLTAPETGAAGCVDLGPGGTHAAATAFSVLADAVSGTGLRADLVPAGGDGSGWRLRTRVKTLRVDGTAVDPVAGADLAVGDWATLTVGAQLDLPRLRPLRYWAAALELKLTRARAGLPAGTIVLVGYAAANRAPAPPPPSPPPPSTTTAPTTTTPPPAPTTTAAPPPPTTTTHAAPSAKPKPAQHTNRKRHTHRKPRKPAKPKGPQPLKATPPLQLSGYVFPIAGGADWGDSYGGARSDVPGGWHHGDDLFAPIGTPVLAVADGTVFAVGWNSVGGWRLWLADAAGNDFYYAHLSGYTRLARNGVRVRRGDVLGFVGNTGDAVTTEPHLHFEVHPNPLLYLGYNGAVDPSGYLRAWPLAKHVHVLPPVQLPGSAPAGFGSLTDFRKLLAVHPLPPTHRAPARRRRTATPAAPPPRLAVAGTRRASAAVGGRTGGSTLPIVFGIVILAGALAAVAHSARDGRT